MLNTIWVQTEKPLKGKTKVKFILGRIGREGVPIQLEVTTTPKSKLLFFSYLAGINESLPEEDKFKVEEMPRFCNAKRPKKRLKT